MHTFFKSLKYMEMMAGYLSVVKEALDKFQSDHRLAKAGRSSFACLAMCSLDCLAPPNFGLPPFWLPMPPLFPPLPFCPPLPPAFPLPHLPGAQCATGGHSNAAPLFTFLGFKAAFESNSAAMPGSTASTLAG